MSALVYRRKHYTPREQFSPSGLDTLSRCGWAWYLRYVLGYKEQDLITWDEAQHLPEPEEPARNEPAVAWARYREEKKEHSRLTKRALGHAIHHAMQVFYDWHPPLVDVWHDKAWARVCALATAGLEYMPSPNDFEWLRTEQRAQLERFLGRGQEYEDIYLFGFIDLVGLRRHSDLVEIWDYKSTGNLDWMPTPEEMQDDVQACSYAAWVCEEFGQDEVACTWVYFCTDPKKRPEADCIRFVITYKQACRVLEEHQRRARAALGAMRWCADEVHSPTERQLRTLPVLQKNPEACKDFNGCPYHHTAGGDCSPPKISFGRQAELDEEKKALLQRRKEARQARLSGGRSESGKLLHTKPAWRGTSSPSRSAHHSAEERHRRMAKKETMAERLERLEKGEGGGGETAGGGERESEERSGGSSRSSSASSEKPANKPGRKPRTKVTYSILIEEEGEKDRVIALPEGTGLHDRVVAAVEAFD